MKKRHHFLIFICIFLLLVGVMSFIYHRIEAWSYLDSIYFVVISMTTIGYGDIVPVTDAGKILTMIASFFGIAMFFYLVSLIGVYIFERKLKKLGIQIDSKIKLPFGRKKKKKRK